ncbi:zinc finger RNA-binding protein-like isoform X2 [Anneissia japonica]|uniref:zinc finger RNA-binding protein-like isoform X2 n=1 Tax=Anneissia japonica TaxID=1529436 RepID=UPI0014254D4F|nr:zinc finger RNA-binding protein-like isoform X2 [Anneissia japonica]
MQIHVRGASALVFFGGGTLLESTMASGGYFGFTHGGTQYSAQQAAAGSYAAQPAQHAGYVQAHQAHQAPAYATATAAPRAAATATVYEANYQPAHAAGGYTYGTTQRQDAAQVVSTPAFRDTYATYGQTSATPAYEKQTYYQPQTTQQHSSTDGYYAAPVAVKATAAYGSGGGFTTHQPAPAKPVQQPKTVAASYTFSTQTTVPTYTTSAATTYTTGGKSRNTYSGYDAAVYSAATNYYQQQQQVAKGSQPWQNKNKGPFSKPVKKERQPPKQPQIHYCEVCKISCAGPQTYREHLEGQKHKKKEAQLKTGSQGPTHRIGTHSLRCELCDVTCTGQDAYNAHIRGAKHQKVLKLHTKLGKPIPSTEPVKVGGTSTPTTSSTAGAKNAGVQMKATTAGSTAAAASTQSLTTPQKTKVVTKQLTTPKIAFVGGSKLQSATSPEADKKAEAKPTTQAPVASSPVPPLNESKMSDEFYEQEITPVGEDYVEEVKNETGKVISFNCKLCECKFNDPNAKEMHMKGRRHRLQYKKKVDPKYQVEIKPTARVRKFHEEKIRRQMAKDEFLRRRDEEMRVQVEMRRYEEDIYWRRFEEERFLEERLQYEEEMEFFEWQRRRGIPHPRPVPPKPPMMQDMMAKRPDTIIDRHVMAKHSSIYPTEQELAAVQNIVTCCEKSLKLVSDYISEADNPVPMEEEKVEVKKEGEEVAEVKETKENEEEAKKEEVKDSNPRALKGVMRVGVLAKGLLLRGDLNMSLVVLCSEKPTRTLLERVADNLPKRLAETEGKFDLKLCVEEAAIIVFSTDQEIKTSIKILLSSPAMREAPSETTKDPPDVLDRQKCLDALAALRHAKWFQARANCLQSCVIIIRVLRDLCERIPTWSPLNGWPVELLCERVIASAGQPLTPGESLRRIFEAIAGGVILPGGPGMYDPCEKEPTDAFGHLTNQQREDITASAQHALRLIVFRQVHKVLGMEPLPPPQRNSAKMNRKRRRDDSEGGEKEPVDGKKDKKEGENGNSTVDMATTEGASSSQESK